MYCILETNKIQFLKKVCYIGCFAFSMIWENRIFKKTRQVRLCSFYRKSERLFDLLWLLCQWWISWEKWFSESWDFRLKKSERVYFLWIVCISLTTLFPIGLHCQLPFTLRKFSSLRVFNWWSCPWSERLEKRGFARRLRLPTKLLHFSVFVQKSAHL